jgi:agmatine deiminase
MCQDSIFRLPAEWEPHQSTYIAWPNLSEEVTARHILISWIFAEVIRVVSKFEPVRVICHQQSLTEILPELFQSLGFSLDNIELMVAHHTYCWLRDGGPSAVLDGEGKIKWMLWAREDLSPEETGHTANLPRKVADSSAHDLLSAHGLDDTLPFYLEGGAFDTDGQGTLIVTEQCLFAPRGLGRNGLSKQEYEKIFLRYLGIRKVIWLSGGLAHDATNGHVDNVARFVAPGVIAAAIEPDKSDDNYSILKENLERIKTETDAQGRKLEAVEIPMPAPVYTMDSRLPASYLNFYLANGLAAVPTYDDAYDGKVLNLFGRLFPNREVIGVYSRQLILAGGSLHCLTQQEPRPTKTPL